MHHCLKIPEILWTVAELVDDPKRLGTLRSMALTCKQFYDPTIRVLWRDLDSMVPLLTCFPEDVWSRLDDGERRLQGPLRPASIRDWKRPMVYMRHVKKFTSFDDNYSYDPHEALFFLLSRRPVQKLLPNLRHLEWDYGDTAALYADMFISSKLESANIQTTDDDLPSLVQSLADSAPGLRELTLCPGFNNSSGTSQVLNRCIKDFKEFEELRCLYVSLTQDSVLHLATLERLKILHCTLDPSGDALMRLQSVERTDFFSSLTTLGLRMDSVASWMVSLLRLCHMPNLLSFHAYLEQSCSTVGLGSLLKAVGTHITLQDVNITLPTSGRHDEPGYQDAVFAFHSLQKCHDLRDLCLAFPLCVCNVTETSFEQMGDAWPRLRNLQIGPDVCKPCAGISYESLHSVAVRCHELHTVAAHIDLTVISEDHLRSPGLTPCMSLEHLRVFPGSPFPIHGVDLASAVLSAAFPRVAVECPHSWPIETAHEFARLIHLFKLAREQPMHPEAIRLWEAENSRNP